MESAIYPAIMSKQNTVYWLKKTKQKASRPVFLLRSLLEE